MYSPSICFLTSNSSLNPLWMHESNDILLNLSRLVISIHTHRLWWFLPGQVSRTCLWCDLRVMWTSIRSYCVWHKRIFHVKMGPAGETTSAGGCWGHIMSPWIDAPDVPSAHISSRHRSASSRAIKPRRGTDSIILLFKFVAYLFIFSIESEDFSNILHLHRPSSQTHVLGTRTFRKSCLHCRRGL
jgi:hypothetical protein